MDDKLDFKCEKCGRPHATTWRNFKNWIYCKDCKVYFCPQCSNLSRMENIQNFFLWNIISFLLFYFAISILRMPFDPSGLSSVNVFLATSLFAILSAISFFSYSIFYHYISFKNLKRSDVISTCPKCQKPLRTYDHDFLVQFWFTLIFMTTLLSFIFQMFYQLFYSYSYGIPYYPYFNVILPFLIELIIVIVVGLVLTRFMYKKTFRHHHKKTFRTWLNLIVFFLLLILISGSIMAVFQIPGTEFTFDFLFQSIASITWLFPYFLLTGVLYAVFQGLLKKDLHFLIKTSILFGIFTGPFFLFVLFSTFIPDCFFISNFICNAFVFGFLIMVCLFSAVFFMPRMSFKTFRSNKKYVLYIACLVVVVVFALVNLIFPMLVLLNPRFTLLAQISMILFIYLIAMREIRDEWLQKEGNFHQLLEKKMGREFYTLLMAFFIVSLLNTVFFFIQFVGINPTLSVSNWTIIQINSIIYSILTGLILGVLFIIFTKIEKKKQESKS
ncbi:MAG: hypothetical protein ACTSRW_06125 [Candidatus Helarchaeota archaeon]